MIQKLLQLYPFQRLANHIECDVFQFLKSDTGLSHIEAFTSFRPLVSEELNMLFIPIDAHQIDRHMVLL